MIIEDKINSPIHYNSSEIECIDAIEAMLGNDFPAYLQGNIPKIAYLKVHSFKDLIKNFMHISSIF